jgi:hypothetical protein
MGKKYTSDLNFRPRVKGVATELTAGEVFDSDIFDAETFKTLDDQGHMFLVEETEVRAPAKKKKTPDVPEKVEGEKTSKKKTSKKKTSKKKTPDKDTPPKGIWDFDAEKLKEYTLDILLVAYKQKCDEHGISMNPDLKTTEALIEKMTSEA